MSRVPRLSPGVDVRTLPIKPAEAFLISRIDGIVDERELGLITGLEPDAVAATLTRLLQLGVVTFDAPRTAPQPTPLGHRPLTQPGASVSSVARPHQTPMGTPIPMGRPVEVVVADLPPLYDPAELDEPVDLEPEKKRRILDLFYRLEDLNYYELLGVAEQSEKKQIKSAYYVLAPEFHPDKFFRKNLGSFKAKIEGIFARFTLAHDVLTSKQKRPEYDTYLEQIHRNRSMSALLDQSQRDIAAVTSAVEESAKALVSTAPSVPPAPQSTPGRYTVEAPPARPESVQSRRESFARKLAGGGFRASGAPPRPSGPPPSISTPPGGPVSVPPVSSSPPMTSARAADVLRSRYEAARNEAARQQISRYVESAKSALDRKDFASAANAYRIAASLAPNDEAIQVACAQTSQLAATALAEGFLKQAEYEAQNERWPEAALSYAKVCNGRPEDARAHERVAHATIQSGGVARRAVDFARRAVELAPKQPEYHVTLARAYFAAGLDKSANGEIDRALELAPDDAKIRAMAQSLRDRPVKDGKVG